MARPKAHPEFIYKTNRHCCYYLQYHMVLITKFRHPVIEGEIETRLYEILQDLFKGAKCNIIEVNSDKDRVHILFEAPPQVALSHLVNSVKTVTSRRLRKEFPDAIAQYCPDSHLWAESYFVGLDSERGSFALQQYIQNQKE